MQFDDHIQLILLFAIFVWKGTNIREMTFYSVYWVTDHTYRYGIVLVVVLRPSVNQTYVWDRCYTVYLAPLTYYISGTTSWSKVLYGFVLL